MRTLVALSENLGQVECMVEDLWPRFCLESKFGRDVVLSNRWKLKEIARDNNLFLWSAVGHSTIERLPLEYRRKAVGIHE